MDSWEGRIIQQRRRPEFKLGLALQIGWRMTSCTLHCTKGGGPYMRHSAPRVNVLDLEVWASALHVSTQFGPPALLPDSQPLIQFTPMSSFQAFSDPPQ